MLWDKCFLPCLSTCRACSVMVQDICRCKGNYPALSYSLCRPVHSMPKTSRGLTMEISSICHLCPLPQSFGTGATYTVLAGLECPCWPWIHSAFLPLPLECWAWQYGPPLSASSSLSHSFLYFTHLDVPSFQKLPKHLILSSSRISNHNGKCILVL